jgi:amino acid permease
MKTVANNLIWLALFSLMVCASAYPNIAGVAQAVIWVIVALIITIAPLGLIASLMLDGEKLINMAGTPKGWFRRAFGYAKMLAMFSAIAYAGFTVAAILYVIGGLTLVASVFIARDRLKEMA